jgi:prolyl 4-hydroxylase
LGVWTSLESWTLLCLKARLNVLLHSHDFSELHIDKPSGPRILTAFMYLNDVAGGGGTRFGPLNLTVQPKQGKMLLWPSVLDDDPYEWDPRTLHEALPVTAGTKHGSNAWFHLRDFKGPSENECI